MTRARIEEYVPFWFWGNWYIDKLLAEGCFGSTYRVFHEDEGQKEYSVVKIISIPTDEQVRQAQSKLGQDNATIQVYFENLVDDLIKELRAHHYLSSKINIFGYQDLIVVKRENEFGWDILIRMELATTLADFLAERPLSRGQVAWLGIDLCTTLADTAAHGLIHGDIKESNIFFTDDGLCKLGDFSIAKHLSGISRDSFLRGSGPYLAPEVFAGAEASNSSDIYSLGIVLYKLLNNGFFPSMVGPQTDTNEALQQRLMAVRLLAPDQAGEILSPIILKACAFQPKDRYATIMDMKHDLENAIQRLSDQERNELLNRTSDHHDVLPLAVAMPLPEKQPQPEGVQVPKKQPQPEAVQVLKKQRQPDSVLPPAPALHPENQPRSVVAPFSENGRATKPLPAQEKETNAGFIQFEDEDKPQYDDRKRRILWLATLIALFIGIIILLGYLIAPNSMNRFFTSIFARADNRTGITTTISTTTPTTLPFLSPTPIATAAMTPSPAPKPTPTAAPTSTPKPTTTAKPTPTPTPRPTTKATTKATTTKATTATIATSAATTSSTTASSGTTAHQTTSAASETTAAAPTTSA